jgi:type I restriction enzyme M protein
MDNLGRYYTQDLFANLLISQFGKKVPSKVIELGVGGGSLIRAAHLRWSNANYYAADIDGESIKRINLEFPFVKITQTNGLADDIHKKLNLKVNSIDIAICNPPYLRLKNKEIYHNLLIKASLKECIALNHLTSDIVFLAQNLRLLKPFGELGIILPDSLITGYHFQLFRESLLTNHSIKGVIELPDRIFFKTDARTFILILVKGSFTNTKTQLYIANKQGVCYEKIEVYSSKLVERMDFSFHKYQIKSKIPSNYTNLLAIGVEIRRGHFTHSQLKNSKIKYLHTTNLQNFTKIDFENNDYSGIEDNKYARKGDILLSRIGRNIGKVSLVNSGHILISDCIFLIRLPQKYIDQVWETIVSHDGQKWLQSIAHGVCAKVISKRDLLKFPIKF